MGENTAWLVPIEQDRWRGRGSEVADALWDEGIFVRLYAADPKTGDKAFDDFIFNRMKEWRSSGRQIPESRHYIDWSGLILSDLQGKTIVPDVIDDLCCPKCLHDVTSIAYQEAWTWRVQDISKRFIHCLGCGENFISTDIRSAKTPFRWASFALRFCDIPHPEKLDEDLVAEIENILGKCEEFRAWST